MLFYSLDFVLVEINCYLTSQASDWWLDVFFSMIQLEVKGRCTELYIIIIVHKINTLLSGYVFIY